jgi:hypothetical protein
MENNEKNIGLGRKINLIKLSDAFRRHAQYDDQKTVAELVREAGKFARLSTWYDPYEKFRHGDLAQSLGKSVRHIAELAEKLGAEKVVLPVSGDPASPFAGFFNKHVLPDLDLPVKATLQKKEYNTDLSELGPVDWRYKTAIDKGVRGMADINHELRATW